jgi:hypothetical protein
MPPESPLLSQADPHPTTHRISRAMRIPVATPYLRRARSGPPIRPRPWPYAHRSRSTGVQWHLRRHHDITHEQSLFKDAAFPPHARHRRSRSPPRPPWPVAGERSLRPSQVLHNRPNLLPITCISLRRRTLPDISSPPPEPQPAAASVAHPLRSRARVGQPLQSTLGEPLGGPVLLDG